MDDHVLIKLCDLPKNTQSYIIMDGALYTVKVPWGCAQNVTTEARERLIKALESQR